MTYRAAMRGNGVVAQLAVRSARRRTGRIAVTVVAVALATAFAVAAFGVSAQMSRLLEGADAATDAVAALPEGSVVVTASTAGATEPTALSDDLVDRARAVDGVLTAGGTYEQPIAVRIPRGTQDDRPPALRGLVFSSAWDPARWQLVTGDAPGPSSRRDEPVEVALSAGGLLSAGARVGEVVRLQTPTGGVEALVVGEVAPAALVRNDGTPGIEDANVVIDAAVLPDLLGARGRVDRITVVPEPGVRTDLLVERLRGELPSGLRIGSADDPDVLRARAVAAISGGVVTATSAFALLSALVAALLVTNTFAIVVAQRTAELALTRCLGLTRGQSTATFLAEAALIGALATVVGLALGVPLSMVGATVLQPGATIRPLLSAPMVWAALGVGLGVTLLAAVVPAVRAGRVPPVEALQTATARRVRRGPLALAVTPLLAVVGLLGRRSRTLRLALAGPRQDPRRAGATISTLCIGLGLMAMVLVAGASIREAVSDQFESSPAVDLYVRRRGVVRVDAAALERRLGVPDPRVGYVDVTTVEGVLVGPDGTEPAVTSVDLGDAEGVVDLDFTSGGAASLQGGAMVSESTAAQLGVGVGDSVELRSTSGQELELAVQGVYRRTAFVGPALVDRAAARSVDAEGTFDLAAITLPDGAPTERVRRALDRHLAGFNRLGVDTPEAFAEVDTDIAETVTRLALVLLSGAVLLGGLGAANNVSLSVLERRRELALLRAIGASRHQVRSLVTAESVVLCGLAGALGAAVGTVAGIIGVGLAPAEFAATARVPWVGIGALVLGALLLGALAAAVPARAAVRRGVLEDLDAP